MVITKTDWFVHTVDVLENNENATETHNDVAMMDEVQFQHIPALNIIEPPSLVFRFVVFLFYSLLPGLQQNINILYNPIVLCLNI